MKTSIIIPCYWSSHRHIEMTLKCVETMYSFDAPDQLLLVDDCSPMPYPEEVPHIIERKENGGYAAAVNSGLEVAYGDILIIANNDLEFIQPDWLSHLIAPLRKGAGLSLIRSTDPDGWSTEDKMTENDKFGCLWAMTRECYEKVGPLDERFGKGYFEDLDYWRRVQDAGFKIVKNHNGLVHHIGKQTFKDIDPDSGLYRRNMYLYKQKWGDKAYIFENEPNSLLLVDDYEIKDEQRRRIAKQKGISVEEAERRWGKVL